MQPGSGTATAIALRRALDLLKRRGLLIVISDLYDEGEAVDRELRHAVRIGHEAAVFGRFWTMHLADLAAASPRPVELRFDRAVAAPGSLVTLTATLRETEFQNRERHVALPEVRGRIIGARGEEQRIRLWPTAVPGVFEAQWKAGTPGRYDVQVSTESGSTRDTIFMVDERAVLIPASDAEGLALVAASNGGVATTIEEIARLEEWLRALPRSHARIDVHPARSFWWTLAFVALLGAEWTLGRAGAWRARR
jgi:hypothetical protein